MFFHYSVQATPQNAEPFMAAINLRDVVAIRAPQGAEVVLVQTRNGKGFHLPYDAHSVEALKREFGNMHAGLVGVYQFTDPDRDDVIAYHASVRLDCVLHLHRVRHDPSFVVLHTIGARGMVLPYNRNAVIALLEAVRMAQGHPQAA